MEEESEILSGLLLELRRGTIILCVFSQLDTPQYGYSLMQRLEEKGSPVDAGTLYPLLRRLEKQGLLTSEWEVGGAKPRKYYLISDLGKSVYEKLCGEWNDMVERMDALINREGE